MCRCLCHRLRVLEVDSQEYSPPSSPYINLVTSAIIQTALHSQPAVHMVLSHQLSLLGYLEVPFPRLSFTRCGPPGRGCLEGRHHSGMQLCRNAGMQECSPVQLEENSLRGMKMPCAPTSELSMGPAAQTFMVGQLPTMCVPAGRPQACLALL